METALARLRAKTDQDLCILISRQLRRSRKLAGRGAYQDAAREFLSAQTLLTVADFSPADRAKLERLMHEVRQVVELPVRAVA